MSFILLYGRPGTGKTTLACSMTKLGYKVHILDIDAKAREMENIKPLVEKGVIKITPIDEKLVNISLEERLKEMKGIANKLPFKQTEPQGYLAYCREITKIETEMAEGKVSDYQVLVCDSFTAVQEHMRRLILFLNRKEKFTFDEWDNWKTNIEEFVTTHRRLQGYFKHVIIISHEQFERDELIGKIEVLPMVDGSMKYKLGGYFTEVYRTFVEGKAGGKYEYKVATKPMERADARTSRALEPIEAADFYTLFKEERK